MAAVVPSTPFLSGLERAPLPVAGAEPEWLAALRRQALRRFGELGLPTRRMEEWRFTSLAQVADTEFALADRDCAAPREVLEHLSFAGCDRLVFVDGHLDRELCSIGELPDGVMVGSLAEGIAEHPEVIRTHLGRHARFDEHAIVALNSALFRDGALVALPRGAVLERPIHVLYLGTSADRPRANFPRTLVVAGEASQASIVESYGGPEGTYYLCAPVTELILEQGAVIDHVREQREGRDGLHLGTQHVRQGRDSSFTSHAISLGARLARLDLNHVLAEEGGHAVLDGLYLVEGDQHTDTHMRVEHTAPHCDSHELYKGVLDGEASAVFSGLIHVHPGAQKTNAKQSNRNLLLSRKAQVNSNPQLEIFADDVKCTHGSTVGQLDEEAVFYLRSRGLSVEAARSILTYAFAAEVVEGIRVEPVREELKELLFGRLPQGEIVRQAV